MNPYTLALLAALSFALGSVLQQRGTLQTAAPEGDPRFLAEIIRKPVWLFGGLMQVLGWIMQAAALEDGSLVLVQSLISLSLVFALPLGVRFTNQHVGRRSIIGACLTLLGIITFVAMGQPQSTSQQQPLPGGHQYCSSLPGWNLTWQAHAGEAISATLFATAAGLGFAFQAAVTKVFAPDRLRTCGYPHLLDNLWSDHFRIGWLRAATICVEDRLPGTSHGCL
jgi:drug/metabolite transporter (DMT)-like permease